MLDFVNGGLSIFKKFDAACHKFFTIKKDEVEGGQFYSEEAGRNSVGSSFRTRKKKPSLMIKGKAFKTGIHSR